MVLKNTTKIATFRHQPSEWE